MNVILSKTGDRRAISCRTVDQARILQPAKFFCCNVVLQIRSDCSVILMLDIPWAKMSMLLWKKYSYFNQKYALSPMQINIAVSFDAFLRFISIFFIRYGKEPGTTRKRSLFDLVVNSQKEFLLHSKYKKGFLAILNNFLLLF